MAGAYYLISRVTTTSNVSSVTFSKLPKTFAHLHIMTLVRTGRTGASSDGDWVELIFNGDTSANYDNINLVSNVGAADGSRLIYDSDFGATSAKLGRATNTSASSLYRGPSEFYIPSYQNTTFNKVIYTYGGSTATNMSDRIAISTGKWRNTSPITSVTIKATSTNNILANSVIDIYGIKSS
jgi:hypothetical protein